MSTLGMIWPASQFRKNSKSTFIPLYFAIAPGSMRYAMFARHALKVLALGFALFSLQASGAGHTSIAITPVGLSLELVP